MLLPNAVSSNTLNISNPLIIEDKIKNNFKCKIGEFQAINRVQCSLIFFDLIEIYCQIHGCLRTLLRIDIDFN